MKREIKDKKKFIIYCTCIAVAVFALGIGSGAVLSRYFDNGGIAAQTTEPTQSQKTSVSESSTAAKESSKVRMMCAGNNLIQEKVFEQAKTRAQNGGYDFKFTYEQIADVIALSDFSVLNETTPLAATLGASGDPFYNSPCEAGDYLSQIGFKVVNQAGTHVFDVGETGAQQTVSFWKSKADTLLTGLYSDKADVNTVKTNTVNGITFSHLGFSQSLNGQCPEGSVVQVVSPDNPAYSEDSFMTTMKAMVQKAKASSDIVCVYFCFKQENTSTVSDYQEKIISALVESGADVIIGTGISALQPVRFIDKAGGGRALIVYSLGNLISAQSLALNAVGAIADITFSKDALTGAVSIDSAGMIPVITHYDADFADIHAVPLYAYDEAQASAHGIDDFSYSYITDLLSQVISPEFLESNPFSK